MQFYSFIYKPVFCLFTSFYSALQILRSSCWHAALHTYIFFQPILKDGLLNFGCVAEGIKHLCSLQVVTAHSPLGNKVTSPHHYNRRSHRGQTLFCLYSRVALTARVCCVYQISLGVQHLAVWCESFPSSWVYLSWMGPTGRKSSTPLKNVVEIIQTCCRQGKLSLTEENSKIGKDTTSAADRWLYPPKRCDQFDSIGRDENTQKK